MTLKNKISLSRLELNGIDLLPKAWQSICSQLTSLFYLEHIELSNNNLCHISSLTLSNKTSLTHLNLSDTNLSPHMCWKICQQLYDFISLKYFNLSNINLSEITSLTLSNNTSLNCLNLKKTQMSMGMLRSIYRQIICLDSLENIYVEGFSIDKTKYPIWNIKIPIIQLGKGLLQNMINRFVDLRHIDLKNIPRGSLHMFLPDSHPLLAELQMLNLRDGALNKDDLQHLLHIAHKLPKLKKLDLSGYTLTGCLSSFLLDLHRGLQVRNS